MTAFFTSAPNLALEYSRFSLPLPFSAIATFGCGFVRVNGKRRSSYVTNWMNSNVKIHAGFRNGDVIAWREDKLLVEFVGIEEWAAE